MLLFFITLLYIALSSPLIKLLKNQSNWGFKLYLKKIFPVWSPALIFAAVYSFRDVIMYSCRDNVFFSIMRVFYGEYILLFVFILFLLPPLLALLLFIKIGEHKRKLALIIIKNLVIIPIFIFIMSMFIPRGFVSNQEMARDTRRVVDLVNVQKALKIYYEKNLNFPMAENWEMLGKLLINIGVANLPNDPLGKNKSYYYKLDPASDQHYVLGSWLEHCYLNVNGFHDSKYDLDDLIYGLNCDDPMYCIKNDFNY